MMAFFENVSRILSEKFAAIYFEFLFNYNCKQDVYPLLNVLAVYCYMQYIMEKTGYHVNNVADNVNK